MSNTDEDRRAAVKRHLEWLKAGGMAVGAIDPDPVGYVVLARRPTGLEPISAVFPGTSKGLEQAQNAQESRTARSGTAFCSKWPTDCWCDSVRDCADATEYVIGEIRQHGYHGRRCQVGLGDQAGAAMSDLTRTIEYFQDWLSRNGHFRCTCGEKLADHWADLGGCATNVECQGFNLDGDPLVNRFT